MLKQAAVQAILRLHAGTLHREIVDDVLFATIAGNDLALLYQLAERWPEAALLRSKLQSLEAILRSQLYGRELSFAWSHGDYWPGNILVQPTDGAISGIVDWDRASAEQIPLHDLLHLLAYTRKLQRRSDLGEAIVSYLLPAAFDKYERSLVKEAIEGLTGDDLDDTAEDVGGDAVVPLAAGLEQQRQGGPRVATGGQVHARVEKKA